MESSPNDTINSEVLPELSARFNLRPGSLSLVQDHRNFVYEASSPLGAVILKVIPSIGSRHNLLLGELDWMAHLHANGVSVPEPLASRDGRLAESLVIEGQNFSACCYGRVDGPLWQQVDNPSDYVAAVGRLAGKMHRVSVGYVPSPEGARRPAWGESPWLASPKVTIHPSMPGVIERCLELREALSQLPPRDWGLVHDDLHGGNVVIARYGPAAIDFECSHYSWLVAEIASALFFWLWKTPDSQPRELAHRAVGFLRDFVGGYVEEHPLSAGWVEAVPLFLQARELSIFASFGLQAEDFETHGKYDRTFSWMKDNIENGVPYIPLDFRSLRIP